MTPIKSKTYSYDGDYLILPGNGANVGMSIHYIGKFEAYQRTYLLSKRHSDINFLYLQIILNAYWKDYNKDKQYGSAIPYIKLGNLENFLVPLAPLKEQVSIVEELKQIEPLIDNYAKLESQATKLDTEIYDKLKKSILQYAIQGNLVEQDENDEPASVLLERIRAEKKAQLGKKYVESYIYKGDDNCYYEHIDGKDVNITEEIPFDLPENWCWSRLDSVISIVSDGTHKTPNYVEKGIPFLSVQNISSGKLDLSKIKYITEQEHKQLIKRVEPKVDDILLCRIGTLGKAIKITWTFEFSIFVSLGLLRVIDKNIIDFLVMLINSPYGDKWISENKVGGGTHTFKINLNSIPNMLLPIPPLAEQKRIVDKINEIFAKL